MTVQGTQITFVIPQGVTPGTILSVPVKNGAAVVKVRVPRGLGAGSSLIMTQAEGSDEWGMQVGNVVPPAEEEIEVGEEVREEATRFTVNGDGSPMTKTMPNAYEPVEVVQPGRPLESAVAYTVRLNTTVGVIDIIVRPDWAPLGTRRFLELAARGHLADLAFYRAIKGCIVQFGLPAKQTWPCIPDDPQTGVPFLLGAVSFAAIGENTRRSTLFICIGDMSHMLGQKSWETPIGAVAESSLDVLERIETGYGDIAEFGGSGPDTARINSEGNTYLQRFFPGLTYIRSAAPLNWPPPEEASQVEVDPAVRALRASTEARQHADQASDAAEEAARAEHVAAARQASERAQAAAQAAEAAAETVRALLLQAERQAQQAQQAMAQAQAQAARGPQTPTGADGGKLLVRQYEGGSLAMSAVRQEAPEYGRPSLLAPAQPTVVPAAVLSQQGVMGHQAPPSHGVAMPVQVQQAPPQGALVLSQQGSLPQQWAGLAPHPQLPPQQHLPQQVPPQVPAPMPQHAMQQCMTMCQAPPMGMVPPPHGGAVPMHMPPQYGLPQQAGQSVQFVAKPPVYGAPTVVHGASPMALRR